MWCTFEIATFARIKAGEISKTGAPSESFVIDALKEHVRFMPLYYTVHRLCSQVAIIFVCSAIIIANALESIQGQAFGVVLLFTVHPVVSALVNMYERSQRRKCEQVLTSFDIRHAKVSVEEDRKRILDHVDELWGSVDLFNHFVRNDLF